MLILTRFQKKIKIANSIASNKFDMKNIFQTIYSNVSSAINPSTKCSSNMIVEDPISVSVTLNKYCSKNNELSETESMDVVPNEFNEEIKEVVKINEDFQPIFHRLF